MKLEIIRKKIDRLDEKILELLARRFSLAKEAGLEKSKKGIPLKDQKREKEIIAKLLRKNLKVKISSAFLAELFTLIIEESKRIQNEK